MSKVVFPSFSGDEFKPYEIRQLVSALELRFQSLESNSEALFDTDTGDLDGRYSQIGHTHSESEITDLQAYLTSLIGQSIFNLDDVTGTPVLNDTLVWNGAAFVPAGAAAVSIALDELSDVSVPAPNDGEALIYNATSMEWEASSTSAITSFFDLTDTDLSSQGQYDLAFNADGTEWQDTNSELIWNPVGDYLQLANEHSINWLDSGAVTRESLVMTLQLGTGDPFYSEVGLLLSMEGTDGDTAYSTDDGAMSANISINTSTEVDSAAVKFGSTSMLFPDVANNVLTAQIVSPSDAFVPNDALTMEMQHFPNSVTELQCIGGNRNGTDGWAIYHLVTGEINIQGYNTSVSRFSITSSSNPIISTWYHLAITRTVAGLWTIWMDGVDVGNATESGTVGATGADTFLFGYDNSVAGRDLDANLDEVRFTKGTARYTTAFTPPTEEFPKSSDGSGSSTDAFVVGNSAIDTIIDGLTTRLASAETDIDGTLNVDGTSTFLDDVDVTGVTESDKVIAGDPGTEGTGITVNGVTYESVLKASDIGGTNAAQFIMHRHSTTLPALIIGARAKDDTDGHTVVADNDQLLNILAAGWDGVDSYSLSSEIRMEVDGTPGGNDMPGQITFMTSADGTETPLERMRIRADGSVEIVDPGGTDYASFSHDGTDFNTVFTNTNDWSISGITSTMNLLGGADFQVQDGGALRIFNSADTDAATFSHDGTDFNVVDTNSLAHNHRGAFEYTFFQDGGDSGTRLIIGPYDGTLAGNNNDGGLYLVGEQTGITYGSTITQTGANVNWSGNTDYATSPATNIQTTLNFDITGGNYLRIRDTANTDWAQFDHDGIDFNTTFTNTADWNIAGQTNVRIASDLFLNVGAAAQTDLFIGEPTTLRGDAQDSSITMYGESTGVIYGLQLDVVSVNSNLRGVGANPVESLLSRVNIDIIDDNFLRIRDSANTDWAEFSHDGTGFNTAFTNTTSWSITGQASVDLLASSELRVWDTANTDNLVFSETGSEAQILSNTNPIYFYPAGAGAGAQLLQMSATQMTMLNGNAFSLQDSTDTDTAIFSHDGTDFNTVFTGTADWQITGLVGGNIQLDGSLIVDQDLTVSGTLTSINTSDLNIADNIFILNSDEVGVPSQNAGMEVERGTSLNVQVIWNETSDKWTLTEDGSNWYDILNSNDLPGGGLIVDGTVTSSTLTWSGTAWVEETQVRISAGGDLAIWDAGLTGAINWAHDGTNLNQSYVATSFHDYVGGIDHRFRDGASVFIYDSTDADSAEFSHNGSNFFTDFTNTGSWVLTGLTSSFQVNHEAAVASQIVIGEPTVLRGDNQNSAFTMYGEQTSLIYGAQFSVGASSIMLNSVTANDVIALQTTMNVDILSGNNLTIRDTTNVKHGIFSHDSTDFNTAFTTTTDWNITGFTGDIKLPTSGNGGIIWGSGAAAFAIRHDGTDVNFTHSATTDWNITGITSIQAGTVDADFDDLTADSLLVDGTGGGGGSAGIEISSALPRYVLEETDAAVNNQVWYMDANGEQFAIKVANDARSATTNALTINRTLNVIDSMVYGGSSHSFEGDVSITEASPMLRFIEDDATLDEGRWRFIANGDIFTFNTINDAESLADIVFSVTRTAEVVDLVTIGGTQVNFTGAVVASGNITSHSNIIADTGGAVVIWDAANVDNASLSHDGTQFNILTAGAAGGNIHMLPAGGAVRLLTGTDLIFNDPTDTDTGTFSHDGQDFLTTFVNTNDWIISGLAANTGGVDVPILKVDAYKMLDMPSLSTERGAYNPIIQTIRGSAQPIHGDEEFAVDENSIIIYDNSATGTITVTRALASTEDVGVAPPNATGFIVHVDWDGTLNPEPGDGGWQQSITSEENHTFVQLFQARITSGAQLVLAENAQGTNNTSYWLSNTVGTGEYEWYARVSHCGDSGTFGTGGHIYVDNGGSAWDAYIASSEIYDVTEIPDQIPTGGLIADGTGTNNTLRWSGSAWAENANVTHSAAGTLQTAGVHIAPVGGSGAPAYTFTGDLTTGMYRAGAGTLAFTTAGDITAHLNNDGQWILFDPGGTNSMYFHETGSQAQWHADDSNIYLFPQGVNVATITTTGMDIGVEANATTTINIGESTTLRGDAQASKIQMFGEQTSVIYGVSLTISGAAMLMDAAGGNSITDFQIANGINLDVLEGGTFRIRDSINTTYTAFDQSATELSLTAVKVATANLQFVNYDEVLVRDGATFRIYESADVDNAAFSHDGTDFHTVFTGTGDWNLDGLTSLWAPATLYIESDDTAILSGETVGTLSFYTNDVSDITDRNVATIRAVAEADYVGIDNVATSLVWATHQASGGLVDKMTLTSDGTLNVNRRTNSTSFISIGESATLRGDSQDSQLILYGEQTAAIRAMTISNTGANMGLFADGGSIQISSPTQILSGNTFQILDSTNSDIAQFSHDGADLNTAFTTTADWNISGLTGNFNIQSNHATIYSGVNETQDLSIGPFEGATVGSANDGRILIFGDSGTNIYGTRIEQNARFLHIAPNSAAPNPSEKVQFYLPAEMTSGMTLKWDDTTSTATFGHDGTDFNTAFTGTTDWNITGLTAIQAGTVDADFDAITATSYGGILEANLADLSINNAFLGNISIASTAPILLLNETDAAVDNAKWYVRATGETFRLQTVNDAESIVANVMTVDRTGTVVDSVAFGAPITATSYGGILEANLLSRIADEAVSGNWTWSGSLITDDSTTVRAGFNIPTGVAPTAPAQGDMWVTATDALIRINGVSESIISTGGAQTPWASDIDGAGFGLDNIDRLEIQAPAIPGDTATFTHDGTNFNTDFALTANWWIDGLTTGVVLRTGTSLHINDSSNADAIIFSHNGTDALIDFNGTTALQVRDGVAVRVQNSTNLDWMGMFHDGTDFQMGFVNTTDVNIGTDGTAGAETLKVWMDVHVRDGQHLRVYDGTDVDYVGFFHNGTNFEILESGTTDIQFPAAGTLGLSMLDNALTAPIITDYAIESVSSTPSGTTQTLTYTQGPAFEVDLVSVTGNITITLSGGPPSGTYGEMIVKVKQDDAGSRTITWAGGTFEWPAGVAPTLTPTASSFDIFHFSTWDGGTTWWGTVAQDMK